MPVQIDELIITTTVNPADGSQGGASASTPVNIAAMGDEIAEKVLQVIREKSER